MKRFWFEIVAGVLFLAAAVLTMVEPAWIEVVTGADPDGGDGGFEWFVTGTTALLAAASFAGARRDWLRHRMALT